VLLLTNLIGAFTPPKFAAPTPTIVARITGVATANITARARCG
jgi:hypothetical protein